MVDHGRKRRHFCFTSICGPKVNNSLENSVKQVNTGLPNQFCFEMLLK